MGKFDRYQCQIAVLDSRSYGSPQNRRRCFILASRIGTTLPRFPQPSYANPLTCATRALTEEGKAVLHIGRGTPGTAPMPAVTVKDAISDMPRKCLCINRQDDLPHLSVFFPQHLNTKCRSAHLHG